MKKTRIQVFGLLFLWFTCFTVQCFASDGVEYTISKNTDFGSVDLAVTIEDFNNSGFAYGDSLDVLFSSGETLMDIPYYNGYYVKTGMPLVVGYPGYKSIVIARNNDPLWDKLNLTEGGTAKICIREKGKYAANQEAFSMAYTDERNDYSSDESFANYRSLTGGCIKPKTFFRGASSIDDQHKRAGTVDKLIKKQGIRFDLDLSDNEEKIKTYLKNDSKAKDYLFTKLYSENKAALVDLKTGYKKHAYASSLADGFRKIASCEGPYYIHCVEGKDRTGFACVLLEALAGASYQEIEQDYMKTYENYFFITKENAYEKYQAVKELRLDEMIAFLTGSKDGADLSQADIYAGAKQYLKMGGMTDAEIDALEKQVRGK